MRFTRPVALLTLIASSVATPETATSTTPSATSSDGANLAAPPANGNTPVDAFTECLWPTTDRIVAELYGLPKLSFNKLIDEIHWEVLWWGNPKEWVPDLLGIGINATFVAGCLLEVVGEGLAYSTTDLLDEWLKTLDLIPRNTSNTDVPGL
ncbi:hypothetical protein BDV59DRAFT_204139 [Aspergillus ambiguus]|uniref:uncharacterized protein n=1 Tax=Aspergillus ambiguus TaxID=176160 RepID=UPI003CCD15DC